VGPLLTERHGARALSQSRVKQNVALITDVRPWTTLWFGAATYGSRVLRFIKLPAKLLDFGLRRGESGLDLLPVKVRR
jgi:hypothetical protein